MNKLKNNFSDLVSNPSRGQRAVLFFGAACFLLLALSAWGSFSSVISLLVAITFLFLGVQERGTDADRAKGKPARLCCAIPASSVAA